MQKTNMLSLIAVCALVAGPGLSGTAIAQGSGFMASGSGSTPAAAAATKTVPAASIAPVRPFSTGVRNGILTVDGMVAKAQMNYDINGRSFLYFTVPQVGTVIVAQSRFMNATVQKDAFHGNVLTLNVGGHVVELTSDGPLLKDRNSEAWVNVDPLFGQGLYPQMGFGDTIQRPYVWPGSKAVKVDANAQVQAPPLPVLLRPKPEVTSSYTVVVPPTKK